MTYNVHVLNGEGIIYSEDAEDWDKVREVANIWAPREEAEAIFITDLDTHKTISRYVHPDYMCKDCGAYTDGDGVSQDPDGRSCKWCSRP